MGQVSFDEEQSYMRTSGVVQKGSFFQFLRTFLISLGVPASSVDYVFLAGAGMLVIIAVFLFMSSGSGVHSPRPPLDELQRMNVRTTR